MKKVVFYSIFLILYAMSLSACKANLEENAALYSLSEDDIKGYVFTDSESEPIENMHLMSKKDTDSLSVLLDRENGWTECELCNCVGAYEFVIDDTRYIIDPFDLKHPIMYGSMDGKIKSAMINDEVEMLKVCRLIRKWIYLDTSYEAILEENMNKVEQAAILKSRSEENPVTLSVEDTKRIRELLSVDAGWEEEERCECIGEYELILDNISYLIDITDVGHQIKVNKIGITNKDKTVVQDVYDIVGNYMD